MPLQHAKKNRARVLRDLFTDRDLLVPLLIGFVAVLLGLLFLKIGGEATAGGTRIFDLSLLQLAQSLRATYPWLAEVMRDLSGLGSTIVLTLFSLATLGYLILVRAKTAALLLVVSVISGTLVVNLFKAGFGRLRPEAAYAELMASGLSFPSGHSSMSAIVYLTLGALVASTHQRWAERVYILLAASLMTLLIGLSRIALGVHWATDVLGGWALGVAWAMVWLVLAHQLTRLMRRGSAVN